MFIVFPQNHLYLEEELISNTNQLNLYEVICCQLVVVVKHLATDVILLISDDGYKYRFNLRINLLENIEYLIYPKDDAGL